MKITFPLFWSCIEFSLILCCMKQGEMQKRNIVDVELSKTLLTRKLLKSILLNLYMILL